MIHLKVGSLIFFLSPLFICCNNQPTGTDSGVKRADSAIVSMRDDSMKEESMKENKKKQNDSTKIEVKTFMVNKEWGYDIILSDKLYIHQPNIPSVSGNNGFKTKEDAAKTGEFVAYEIRNHILPPTVTPEQLDSLGVIEKK